VAALIALLRAESAQLRAESQALRAAQGANRPGGSGSPGGNNSHNNANNNASNHNNSNASNNNANANGGGGSASPILETSSTQLVVTVDLDATKQSEAKVGERVTVQMPGGNTVNGTITAVSPVAQSSSGNGGSGGGNGGSSTATIPVTITLSAHPRGAGLDQAAVSVNFAQARARNVLSVPVTALLATGGGAYAVQEAAAPRSLIPVTTGLFAAGYVEISGPGISQGLQVTDSQG
jgi:hypothetical protein